MDTITPTVVQEGNESSLTNDLITQMQSRIHVMSKSIMTRFEDMDEQFELLEKRIDDLVTQARSAEKQQGSSTSPTSGTMVATSRVISRYEYTSPKVVTPKGHRRAGSFSRRCEV